MKDIYYIGKLFALILLGIWASLPFVVRADDPQDAPSFSIPLMANTWNLVSVPFDLPDENLPNALGDAANSVDTIYMYDADQWFVYHADHPELSTLKTIQPGYGYFIHTTSAVTLSGRGTPYVEGSTPPVRNLESGWNLVGVFEPQNTLSGDIDQVFGSIGFSGVDYLALLRLDPSTQSFTTPDTAAVGDAFWMLLDAPHVYGPSNF